MWSKTRVKSKFMKVSLLSDQLVHCLRYMYQYKEESATLRNTQVWCIHSIRRCTNTFCYPAFIDSHKCGGTWGCQVSWTGEWDPLSRWLHPEQVNSWTSLPQSQTLSGVEHSKPSLCMKTLFLTQKTTKIIRLYMSASHCGLLVPHPSWNWSNQEEPGVFITPNGLHVLYRLIVFGMTHWQASSKFVSHSVCVCVSKCHVLFAYQNLAHKSLHQFHFCFCIRLAVFMCKVKFEHEKMWCHMWAGHFHKGLGVFFPPHIEYFSMWIAYIQICFHMWNYHHNNRPFFTAAILTSTSRVPVILI